MEIKPIDTYYNGYRFRSRLEARWAVFFDALGIVYQYEPEGIESDWSEAGQGIIRYLPDFYLPKYDCYVEVKGTDEALSNDLYKMIGVTDFNYEAKKIIILGDIPNYSNISWGNIPMFNFLQWHKGVESNVMIFTDYGSILWGRDEILRYMFSYARCTSYWDFISSDLKDIQDISVNCQWTQNDLRASKKFEMLSYAYKAARQARFEHGEKPNLLMEGKK